MARLRAKLNNINIALAQAKLSKDYTDQLVFIKEYPSRKARYAKLDPSPHKSISDNLADSGITQFYTHQTEAITHARAGRNVVVVTETASGKSLCYNIPVLETILADPSACALYIFPTKALTQDQARTLHQIADPEAMWDEKKCFYAPRLGNTPIRFGIYDGDTPNEERRAIRRDARIMFTNPDMLSLSILPHHLKLWAPFFKKLRYVVIDEIHTYRGVFGSHVANLMRRLSRICEYHGSHPAFICCSATIANPAQHASALIGDKCVAVTSSGAPSAGRKFALWNPPEIEGSSGARRSPLSETINLFSHFVECGLRTIVFARSKPTVEVILKYVQGKVESAGLPAGCVVSYRGGYLPSERRAIERSLAEGRLMGVTCTNALELGIDIGSLDIAIINGYPGSIASVWQQAGRAGRRDTESLAIFVAYSEPLDQYFMRHPEYFFDQSAEQAIVNPENPYILSQHLAAAAAEIPLKRSEQQYFGKNFVPQVRAMIKEGLMKEQNGAAFWTGDDFPTADINLRTSTADRYAIVDEKGALIGEMDSSTVFIYLHPGAVYLHLGETYIVKSLDIDERTATVTRKRPEYYTRSLSNSEVTIDKVINSRTTGNIEKYFGYVNVTGQVHSFKKVRAADDRMIGVEPLDLPSQHLWTQSLWFNVPDDVCRMVKAAGRDLPGGLHAVEHAAIAILPFLAMCDRDDIGGLSTPAHPDVGGQAAIFIHDACHGGIGLAEAGYKTLGNLLVRTLDLITECSCRDGCPSCIQSPKCGNMNEPLDKRAAIIILKSMIDKIG